jgi:cation transport ATPase
MNAGNYRITRIVADDGHAEGEVLQVAASVLYFSDFPIVPALLERARRAGVAQLPAEKFERVPGVDARALLGGARVAVGSRAILAGESAALLPALHEYSRTAPESGVSFLFVVVSGVCIGCIAVQEGLTKEEKETQAQHQNAKHKKQIHSRLTALALWLVIALALVLYFLYRYL